MTIFKLVPDLLRDEKGATAVEYGLIVSMIVIAIVASLNQFANEASSMWGYIQTQVETAE